MLACLLALLGVALDLILDALDLIFETLDLILEALDLILETLDLILEALDLILATLDLILEALDLILEALGDILGMVWVPDWPGDLRMGWIALRLVREHCFTRIQDPGDGQSVRWICHFWALLSTNNCLRR